MFTLFICGVAKWLPGTSCLLLYPSVFILGPSATFKEDGFTEVCRECVLRTEALEAQESAPCQLALSRESPGGLGLGIGKVSNADGLKSLVRSRPTEAGQGPGAHYAACASIPSAWQG